METKDSLFVETRRLRRKFKISRIVKSSFFFVLAILAFAIGIFPVPGFRPRIEFYILMLVIIIGSVFFGIFSYREMTVRLDLVETAEEMIKAGKKLEELDIQKLC